jgi:integrase
MRISVIHKLKLNNIRQGFFERDMSERVQQFLPPDYVVAITIDETYGWRTQSEVLRMEWGMVDFTFGTLRLDPGMTKNDDGRVVYMTAEVTLRLLEQRERVKDLERQLGQVIPWVFPHLEGRFKGRRIQDFKKAWKNACEKAGYPGMLRHDFRRTAVRNFERAGVPRSTAMKNTGHRTENVYGRYDIVDEADQRMARDRLETHSSLIEGSRKAV